MNILQSLSIVLVLYNLLTTKLTNGCSVQNCEEDVNIKHMQTIESYMDIRADPCNDFYNYACGNWKHATNYTSAYVQQDGKFNQILVDILEKLQQKDNENTVRTQLNAVFEKALYYYESCQKLEAIELEKFLPTIKTEPFVWWKFLAQLQSYGLQDVLLNIMLVQHDSKDKKYEIFLSEHSTQQKLNLTENVLKSLEKYTGLERKLLKTKLEAYEVKLFQKLEEIEEEMSEAENAADENDDNRTKENNERNDDKLEKMHKSEEQSATNYSLAKNETVEVDADSECLTLSDVQRQLPDINWQIYFDILLHNTIQLKNERIFLIGNVKTMHKLLNFFNESDKEDLLYYILTHFLMQLEATLPPHEISASACVQLLRDHMSLAMNQLYEDYHYADIRAESDSHINNIFQRLIANLDVMFAESSIKLNRTQLTYLQRKSHAIDVNIGNMPANRSMEFLLDYYALANITKQTNFYQNHLSLLYNKLQTKYRIVMAYQADASNVYSTFDYTLGWDSVASPYYLFAHNKIIIPFAFLQLPFYHHKLHDIWLYSKLGWVLSHEAMHGFDNQGLLFDADKSFNNFVMSIVEQAEFRKGILCLKPQQTASISERIADVSGLHLLLRAYASDLHALTESERKLFFVNFAQYFCDRNTTVELNLKNLSHDQPNLRASYILSNAPEFAETFNCSASTEEICRLW